MSVTFLENYMQRVGTHIKSYKFNEFSTKVRSVVSDEIILGEIKNQKCNKIEGSRTGVSRRNSLFFLVTFVHVRAYIKIITF